MCETVAVRGAVQLGAVAVFRNKAKSKFRKSMLNLSQRHSEFLLLEVGTKLDLTCFAVV